jgi:hypothetical protein
MSNGHGRGQRRTVVVQIVYVDEPSEATATLKASQAVRPSGTAVAKYPLKRAPRCP